MLTATVCTLAKLACILLFLLAVCCTRCSALFPLQNHPMNTCRLSTSISPLCRASLVTLRPSSADAVVREVYLHTSVRLSIPHDCAAPFPLLGHFPAAHRSALYRPPHSSHSPSSRRWLLATTSSTFDAKNTLATMMPCKHAKQH